MKVTINNSQRKALEELWFVFGNSGSKSTPLNHRFIQGFLEANEDRREFYLNADFSRMKKAGFAINKQMLTKECVEEVDKILKSV